MRLNDLLTNITPQKHENCRETIFSESESKTRNKTKTKENHTQNKANIKHKSRDIQHELKN